MDCPTTSTSAPEVRYLAGEEGRTLLAEAGRLAGARPDGRAAPLTGTHLALLCGDGAFDSGITFTEAARALGARVAHLRPLGATPDPAWHMLGRLYRALACEGLAPASVDTLARHVDLPVLGDLASATHPARQLGDLMALQANSTRPLEALRLGLVSAPDSAIARAWQAASACCGLQLVLLDPAPAAGAPDRATPAMARYAGVDAWCDPGLPPCNDGRPIVWLTPSARTGSAGEDNNQPALRSLASEQAQQHRHLVQALLLRALA